MFCLIQLWLEVKSDETGQKQIVSHLLRLSDMLKLIFSLENTLQTF